MLNCEHFFFWSASTTYCAYICIYFFIVDQVRSRKGDVTGVLDIAKCLYDAVSRLQRAAERDGGDNGGGRSKGDALKMSVLAELGKGKGRKGKAAMQASREAPISSGFLSSFFFSIFFLSFFVCLLRTLHEENLAVCAVAPRSVGVP